MADDTIPVATIASEEKNEGIITEGVRISKKQIDQEQKTLNNLSKVRQKFERYYTNNFELIDSLNDPLINENLKKIRKNNESLNFNSPSMAEFLKEREVVEQYKTKQSKLIKEIEKRRIKIKKEQKKPTKNNLSNKENTKKGNAFLAFLKPQNTRNQKVEASKPCLNKELLKGFKKSPDNNFDSIPDKMKQRINNNKVLKEPIKWYYKK